GREAEARRIRSHHRARARRGRRAGEDASMTMAGLIVALAGCLAVQAFFAASEIALVSADDLKVRAGSEGGHERSRMLDELLANRDRLLALTLTGTNLATVVAAPLLGAETVLSRLLRRLAGVPADAGSVFLSREDLARLMRRRPGDASEQPPDAILPAEQLMISRIFRFSQADARKAMV